MSPQESFICKMADEIRAGRLVVSGALSVTDFGYTSVTASVLDEPYQPPDYFRVDAQFSCRKLTDPAEEE